MGFVLRGARLIDATMDIPQGVIDIDEGCIQYVGSDFPDTGRETIDAADALVIPGFIEVHTHGGGGFNLHTTRAEEILEYARWSATTGVTAFLVGVVGFPEALPEAQIAAAVEAIVQSRTEQEAAAMALGIHLEGPYINEKRRGAHLPAWLRTPNETETEHLLSLTRGHLRLITLAPELPGAQAMIRRLIEAGVTISMGHTDATYEQALTAIQAGVTHITHCFNAMPPLHHRVPGPLAAAVQTDEVLGELIADGVHVHPAMMEILLRILGPERIIIITDALAAAGKPHEPFEFAGQQAHVTDGAARLADGTLTGSVLTMDQALRNILQMTRSSLSEAVGMLTFNPARSARVAARKGLLQRGYDADLLILDQTLNIQATLCRGKIAFANEQWRERLLT